MSGHFLLSYTIGDKMSVVELAPLHKLLTAFTGHWPVSADATLYSVRDRVPSAIVAVPIGI